MTALSPHPDRLFPVDPAARDLARSIHAHTQGRPIISPHGHVSAKMLADDEPFPDPTRLLITPDHYVTRLLHANGVPLDQLLEGDPRQAWRLFCTHWPVFLGTPVRFWLEHELSVVFGVRDQPSADTADAIFDQISDQLARPEFRPRALVERFGISVLATTDDPADDLSFHRRLAASGGPGRVLPTMRADAYTDPSRPGWAATLDRLAWASGHDCGTYAGLLVAVHNRRDHFRAHGATATDAGPADAWATPLTTEEAERLHADGMAGSITASGAVAYRRNLLYRFAAMSAADGLVMQLHPGVLRNHHWPTLRRFGPDTGHDLPMPTAFTEPLRQVLNDFGTAANFRLVLFTVDETAFSREIAPLAGFYPSVYAGAPWWFLDAPAAIQRYRAAVTETAGFYKTSGFIDDTRGLCSIPARHDMSRRLDAAYLAELVLSHQLTEADAHQIASDLVDQIPRSVFRLP